MKSRLVSFIVLITGTHMFGAEPTLKPAYQNGFEHFVYRMMDAVQSPMAALGIRPQMTQIFSSKLYLANARALQIVKECQAQNDKATELVNKSNGYMEESLCATKKHILDDAKADKSTPDNCQQELYNTRNTVIGICALFQAKLTNKALWSRLSEQGKYLQQQKQTLLGQQLPISSISSSAIKTTPTINGSFFERLSLYANDKNALKPSEALFNLVLRNVEQQKTLEKQIEQGQKAIKALEEQSKRAAEEKLKHSESGSLLRSQMRIEKQRSEQIAQEARIKVEQDQKAIKALEEQSRRAEEEKLRSEQNAQEEKLALEGQVRKSQEDVAILREEIIKKNEEKSKVIGEWSSQIKKRKEIDTKKAEELKSAQEEIRGLNSLTNLLQQEKTEVENEKNAVVELLRYFVPAAYGLKNSVDDLEKKLKTNLQKTQQLEGQLARAKEDTKSVEFQLTSAVENHSKTLIKLAESKKVSEEMEHTLNTAQTEKAELERQLLEQNVTFNSSDFVGYSTPKSMRQLPKKRSLIGSADNGLSRLNPPSSLSYRGPEDSLLNTSSVNNSAASNMTLSFFGGQSSSQQFAWDREGMTKEELLANIHNTCDREGMTKEELLAKMHHVTNQAKNIVNRSQNMSQNGSQEAPF